MIKFSIPGEPHGKGRPRFTTKGGFSKPYTPEATASYENLVKVMCQMQHKSYEADVPLEMTIIAYYGIPVSTSKKKRELMLNKKLFPTKKPDADNVAKIICDALNGVAYHDDKQSSVLHVYRFYSDNPRVEVYITERRFDEMAGG